MLRKSVVMLAILLGSLASQVYALGLGNVTVESYLNQPLRVRIEVLDLGNTRLQDVAIQLASTDDFERFNIDRVRFLSNIRFSVQSTVAGNFVYLTTNQVVREPYLSFILDTRWPNGRLLSEHTILLDLPVFQDQDNTGSNVAEVRRPISPVLRAPDADDAGVVDTPAPATEPLTPPTSVAPILEPEIIAPAEQEAAEPEPEAAEEPLQPIQQDLRPPPESAAVEEQAEPEPAVEVADQQPAATEEPSEPEPVIEDPIEEEVEEQQVAAADDALIETEETPEEAIEPEPAEPEPVAAVEAEPEPVAAVEAEPDPVEPETLITSPADTLTDIAEQIQPDGLTLQQTMVAIQELNPDAFIDGNINRMRSGQVLRVPTREEIESVDANDAASEVVRQSQQFADTQPLAAPADAPADDQPPQGQLSVVSTEEAIDATGGAGELDDDQNEELDRRIADLENQLALRQEEADRARIEREELDSRLADLEQQIAAAEELIRLQDLQLAQLQESIAQAAAEAEAEAEAQAAIAAEIAASDQQATTEGGMVNDIMRILTGNTLMMIFGVVLVILLLVVLLIRRNRAAANREDDELDELAEQEFDAIAEEAAAEVTDADEELEQELDDILAGEDVTESNDTPGEGANEVDELITEGKLDQAEAQLRVDLETAPNNHDLRIKLCEVYARAGNEKAFNQQAQIVGAEQSPRLDREVSNLRDEFAIEAPAADDEDTVLDFGSGDAEEEVAEPEQAAEAEEPEPAQEEDDDTASFLDDLGIDLDSFEDDDFELPEAGDSASAETEKEAPAEEEKAGSALLDDLELDGDDVDMTFDLGANDDDSDESDAESEKETGEELDLDVDDAQEGEEADGEPEEDALGLTAELEDKEEPESENTTEDDDAVSLDMDSDAEEAELAAGDSKDAEELDIDSFEFDADEAKPAEAEATAEEEDLDLETFSFDADEVKADLESVEEKSDSETKKEIDEENLLDFDVDEPESAPAEEEPEALDEELETFEFDVDDDKTATDAPEAEEKVEVEEVSFDIGEEGPGDTPGDSVDSDEDDDFIDLDVELGDGEESSNSDDIEIDLEDDVETQPAEEPEEDDLDDLGFLSEDDEVEIESVGEAEEVELLADEDETATKLELAYAYQKMGDTEGAKEILQEVVKEGTDEQVKEANELLASFDQSSA